MSEGVSSPPGAAAGAEEGAAVGAGVPRVRCSDCIVWNRQQTWLCVVPLFIGFVGLGLSLMLLKWIVVGSVKEYVPTELMDSKGIEQDPFFLSKQPTTPPKSVDTTTTSTATTTTSRTPNRISTRLTTMTKAPTRFPGTRGPIRAGLPRSTTARHTVAPPTVLATTTTAVPFSTTILISRPAPGTPGTQPLPIWPTAAYTTSSYKTYLQDSAPSWTLSPFQEASTTTTPEANTSPKYRNLSGLFFQPGFFQERFPPLLDVCDGDNDGDVTLLMGPWRWNSFTRQQRERERERERGANPHLVISGFALPHPPKQNQRTHPIQEEKGM
uniref:Uncharacterized protein n=1 Tax=Podarcis muralis TaxID=64176 RepID=A0A670HZR9_PODMU